MGRKKGSANKTKVAKFVKKEIVAPKEKEILERKLILTEISELKQMPGYWMRYYFLQATDTIEDCCKLYEYRYSHEPLEGWLYTNSQGQRTLHLRISDEEKSSQQ